MLIWRSDGYNKNSREDAEEPEVCLDYKIQYRILCFTEPYNRPPQEITEGNNDKRGDIPEGLGTIVGWVYSHPEIDEKGRYEINKKNISWRTKYYQVALLSNFGDSLVFKTISGFLHDQNPHLRLQAISAISKFEHPVSKNLLINYYNTASWPEKGNIICVMKETGPGYVLFKYRINDQWINESEIIK